MFIRFLLIAFFVLTPLHSGANPIFWIPKIENSLIEYNQFEYQSIDPDDINILVWNVKKLQNKNILDELVVYSQNTDFLLIQESLNIKKLENFYKLENWGNYTAVSFIYTRSKLKTGVSISSKVKPHFVDFKRSFQRELYFTTPKNLIFSYYPIKNNSQKLLIINIHALNFVKTSTLLGQLKLTQNIINEHQGPIIFAGDFNTWSKSKIYNVKLYMEKMGLQEVEFSNGHDRSRSPNGHYLDYIFTKNLITKNANVISDSITSDHKPLRASFYFSSKSTNNAR